MNQDLTGQIINDQFRVENFVAAGGMGAVFRVWDIERNVYLAMKVLHAELAEDPLVVENFRREADALKQLSHPNIAPFYGLYFSDEQAFLLQSYIDGPSLKQIVRMNKGKPMNLLQALIYLKATCSALSYSHVNDVIHCDVKPGNILIDDGGRIYLTDFGIARQTKTNLSTFVPIGTAGYMAPEQIRGEELTPATDIYAVGVMLFEMVAGRRPFMVEGDSDDDISSTGNTAVERVQNAHLEVPPPNPLEFNPDLPPELAAVILTALSKDPNQRYQSAQDLFVAVCSAVDVSANEVPDQVILPAEMRASQTVRLAQQMQSGSGNLDAITQSYYRNQATVGAEEAKVSKFNLPLVPVFFGVAGFFLFVTFAIVVLAWLFGGSGSAGDSVAQSDRSAEMVELATETPSFTATPDFTDTPAYTATPEFTATPTLTFTPEFTPIGAGAGEIAFANMVNGSPQIFLMDTNGENEQQITDISGGACQPEWSPDGSKLLYISPCDGPHHYEEYNGASLYMMNADGSEQVELEVPAASADFDPAWSPDGKMIAFVSLGRVTTDTMPHLFIFDLESKRLMGLASNLPAREPAWSPDGERIAFEYTRQQKIWLLSSDGEGKAVPLSASDLYSYSPEWSPTGKKMMLGVSSSPLLAVKDVDDNSNRETELEYTKTIRPVWNIDYSKDGNWVIFGAEAGGKYEIYRFPLSGDQWDLETIGRGFHPVWRP